MSKLDKKDCRAVVAQMVKELCWSCAVGWVFECQPCQAASSGLLGKALNPFHSRGVLSSLRNLGYAKNKFYCNVYVIIIKASSSKPLI